MSVNIKQGNELVKLASGYNEWTGTKAQYQTDKNNIPAGTVVNITDDYDATKESGAVIKHNQIRQLPTSYTVDEDGVYLLIATARFTSYGESDFYKNNEVISPAYDCRTDVNMCVVATNCVVGDVLEFRGLDSSYSGFSMFQVIKL